MFQRLYTTAMSGNTRKLQKRFVKIRSKQGRLSKLLAVVTTVVILAATICATFVLAAADGNSGLREYAGALYTYYRYPQESMEYNVNAALKIYNEKHADDIMLSQVSSFRPHSILFERYFTPLALAQTTNDYLIDEKGLLVDIYNRREPYYGVTKYWLPKDKSLTVSWEHIQNTRYKTLSIGGKEVEVCFADSAVPYFDDKIIEKMIQNQIAFELEYQSDAYDHNAYISQIIEKGVYVIEQVIPRAQIQSNSYYGGHYGDFTEEAIIADNVNTSTLERNRASTFYSGRVLVPKNVDGNQGKTFCEATVYRNQCLVIDIKNTTDNMPYVNYTLKAKYGLETYSQLSRDGTNVLPGENAETFLLNVGGTRRNYLPWYGSYSGIGVTYEIIISGPESDYADIEVYTCNVSDDMTLQPTEYMDLWYGQYCYTDGENE